MIRSRNHKLPYKEIANRLEKSELACRLHHHHMTVGRKGHRVEDLNEDDDDSDIISRSPSSVTQVEAEPSTQWNGGHNVEEGRCLPIRGGGQSCTLPNFQSFIRDTFHHRSISSPDLTSNPVVLLPHPHDETVADLRRGARTLSGTWVRDNGRTCATPHLQGATVHLPMPLTQHNNTRHNDQARGLLDRRTDRTCDPRPAARTLPDARMRETVGKTAWPGL